MILTNFTSNYIRILVISCGILFASAAAFAEVNIEMSINPSTVSVGEPFQLTIIISGAEGNVKAPKLDQSDLFRSYSQGHSEEISFTNGVYTSRSVFTYVLIPNSVGKHILEQLELNIGGNTFKTGSITVEVVEEAANSRSQQVLNRRPSARVVPASSNTLPPEFNSNEEIFIRSWVDKQSVYINEPVYLTYTLYTRASATFKGFEEEPVTTGFWVEDFPPQGTAARQEKFLGGRRYVIADVRSMALFPTEPGEVVIDPGTIKADVQIQKGDPFNRFYSRDVFGRRRYQPANVYTQVEERLLKTDPVTIAVKPLPLEGKPNSFSGAVGDYIMHATVDTTSVEEGQPITFQVVLKGKGNLNTVELPKLPPMDYFKYYDSSSSLNLTKDRNVVEGTKVLETVLIPKKSGKFTIKPIEFSYFDPRKEQYLVLKTPVIDLDIKPSTNADGPLPQTNFVPDNYSPKEAIRLGEDIRFIKLSAGPIRLLSQPLFRHQKYWIGVCLPIILAIVLLILKSVTSNKFQNTATYRRGKSNRMAKAHLKSAKQVMRPGKEKEFYEKLSRSLTHYFAGKLNMETAAVGVKVLEERMSGQVDADSMGRVKYLFTQIDYQLFSSSQADLESMKQIYNEASDLITHFERKRIR